MLLVREKIFDYDCNKYYVQNGKFNSYSGTTRLPNCTTYCKLRSAEAEELSAPRQMFKGRSATGFPEAKNWYAETILPKGSELRENSIAVFDGSCGHVMYIERKIDSTHAFISESNYDANKNLRNWKFWRTREVELKVGKATISGVGKLLGFIYLSPNDKRVCRNTNVDQVEVLENLVNVRTGAGTTKPVVCQGLYCPIGIFNVLEWKTSCGYTWAKIDTNCWISCGSWTKIYKVDSKADLKNKLKELKNRKSCLEAELKQVNADIKEVEAKL